MLHCLFICSPCFPVLKIAAVLLSRCCDSFCIFFVEGQKTIFVIVNIQLRIG
uniref:Uncharacterized protein n=1 Tax=Arundo donax TaxID=35708 RepID=A0A0A9D6W3_ARUDO